MASCCAGACERRVAVRTGILPDNSVGLPANPRSRAVILVAGRWRRVRCESQRRGGTKTLTKRHQPQPTAPRLGHCLPAFDVSVSEEPSSPNPARPLSACCGVKLVGGKLVEQKKGFADTFCRGAETAASLRDWHPSRPNPVSRPQLGSERRLRKVKKVGENL